MTIEIALVRFQRIADAWKHQGDQAAEKGHVVTARECRLKAQTIEEAMLVLEESDEAVA